MNPAARSQDRLSFPQRVAALAQHPLLLAQGLYVRWVTPRLPEPPGPRVGNAGAGPVLRLLLAGDSAAAGVGAPDQASALSGRLVAALARDRCVSWRLLARTGTTIGDLPGLLETAPIEAIDVVILSIGVNDVTAGTSPARWRAALQRLAVLLAERFDAPRILICAIPPMQAFTALPQPLAGYLGRRAARLNDETRRWAGPSLGCEYVEPDFPLDAALLATDGFHPGPPAYERWAAQLAARIAEPSR